VVYGGARHDHQGPRLLPGRRIDTPGRTRTEDVVRINHQVVVFDAADLAAESSFWARLLGGTVDAEDDWHMVLVDGQPRVGVQLAPDHVAPGWPDGTPQQIHLDLWVDDFEAAHAKVSALGATLLKSAGDNESPDDFQVYADPAGHPFCICWVKKA
jgi:catechol 2,3-dioxygenase-like lactoylglutathione lyase family enzyme